MRFFWLVFAGACGFFTADAIGSQFKAGEEVKVKDGNGLLAVDINTTNAYVNVVKVERVGSLFGGTSLTGLGLGDNVRLVELPAGTYRWSRVDMNGAYLHIRDDERFQFKVEPGVINYPGDLDIQSTGSGNRYYTTVSDRAGRAMSNLDTMYPGVRHKFPLRYQGALPDGFPEFAAAELGDQSAADALKAGAAGELKGPPADTPADLQPQVDELFARPQISLARMNPAGDMVAMVEFRGGKNHVSLVNASTQMAIDVYRGDAEVDKVYWAGDRTLLLQLDLPNGDNNFVVHVAAPSAAAPTFSQYAIPGHGWFVDPLSRDGEHAIYAHSDSDGKMHIFRIDLAGKRFDLNQFRYELRLDKGLDKAFYGMADGNGVLRVALVQADGAYAMMYRPDAAAPWQEVRRYTADEAFELLALSADGTSLIALANKDRAQTDLVRMDLPSGKMAETLFSSPGTDVQDALVRGSDRRAIGVMLYRDGNLDTVYLDQPDDALSHALRKTFPDQNVAVYDTTADRQHALVLVYNEINRGAYYVFDANRGMAQELLSLSAPMPHVHLVRSRLVKVAAADSTPIESYLTLPVQAQARYPLVVVPHGGPIGVRDALGYDPEVQLLANRGYAVLRVNYRGSGGFGRAFEEAGLGGWGTHIEDDILAALDAAMKSAPIDPDRIALRGASYGGYSAMMGLIRTPERFRCAVAASAVADVPLLFNSSDWSGNKAARDRMMKIVGDPTKSLAEMKEISPDFQYHKLKKPLLIIHGVRDKRVSVEHALRMLMLLGHAKDPPQSLFLAHEGHSVTDVRSRYLVEAAVNQFLLKCLAPTAAASKVESERVTAH
jgi:dipeptidyl aminopeptidase/acylaminoacyl peptidase